MLSLLHLWFAVADDGAIPEYKERVLCTTWQLLAPDLQGSTPSRP
jgi:hypothetical protein